MMKSMKKLMYAVPVLSSFYLVKRYVGCIGRCEDVSMEPAIQHGDYVLISPFPVEYNKLQKGDIVFAKAPRNPSNIICKRLVGLAGDNVYNDEKGFPEYIERGQVWLEGDNKEDSIDCRRYGQMPYGLLMSKVCYRIWPLDRIGPLPLPGEETTQSERQTGQKAEMDNISLAEINKLYEEIHKKIERRNEPTEEAEASEMKKLFEVANLTSEKMDTHSEGAKEVAGS